MQHIRDLYKLKFFVPGDSFGELSLITGATRAGTVIAHDTCYFVTIDKPTFNIMMKNFEESDLDVKLNFLKKFSFLESI